jgi:hypothetical protein
MPGIPQQLYGLMIRETAPMADWQRLWADVQAVLEKAGGKGTQGK